MLGGPVEVQKEPKTPRERRNMGLRWLGILVPLVVTYPFLFPLDLFVGWADGSSFVGFQVRMAIGAAIWVGLAAVLARRKDWAGAAAISVFYILVDAWWRILAVGLIHVD
jgi:hypothetical protein